MEYLSREGAPCGDALFEKIDEAVVSAARSALIGRRFLGIFGPLGAGVPSVAIDKVCKSEEEEDGIVKTVGRKIVELPQLFEDFTLLWRDIEVAEKNGYSPDLGPAMNAAKALANKEDKLIFFGSDYLGVDGLFTAKGVNKIERSDWTEGEGAFKDIVAALTIFASKMHHGRKALIVSPDLYAQLFRIQPGTGLIEIDRVKQLVDGNVFSAPVLGLNKAIMVCAEPQYMDIALGADMAAAYLEQKDLNHVFRLMEIAVPRIKDPGAVVVFE